MPIPSPNDNETQNEFMERCMGEETMVEEYDQDQRAAICNRQWENRNDSMDKKLRIDSGRIDSYQYDEDEETLTADVELTRSQVLPYRDDDGEIVKELLPPDELSEDSWLDSTKGKPVTEDHPSDPLNIDSISEHSRGALHDKPSVKELNDEQVSVWNKVTIFNDELIEAIQGGKEQVSIGRQVDVFDESGEYKGDSYDRVQRNFRLNHLAVVDKGRAGPDVKMRMDGDMVEATDTSNKNESQTQNSQDNADDKENSGAGISLKTTNTQDGDNMKLTIGDKELDLEPKNDKQEEIIGDAQDRIDELMHSNKDLEDKKEELEDKVEDLNDKIEDRDDSGMTKDEVKELLNDKEDQIAGKLDKKLDIVSKVQKVDKDYEPNWKKDAKALMKDFITRVDEDVELEDKSDGYVEAKFEMLLDAYEERQSKPVGDNSMTPNEDEVRDDIKDKKAKLQDEEFLKGGN